jgi:hypothetical protein
MMQPGVSMIQTGGAFQFQLDLDYNASAAVAVLPTAGFVFTA